MASEVLSWLMIGEAEVVGIFGGELIIFRDSWKAFGREKSSNGSSMAREWTSL